MKTMKTKTAHEKNRIQSKSIQNFQKKKKIHRVVSTLNIPPSQFRWPRLGVGYVDVPKHDVVEIHH
jgi:hypothetical protein